MGFTDSKQTFKIAFFALAAIVIVLFLYFSAYLANGMASIEHDRVQIWADATNELVQIDEQDEPSERMVEFLFSIIEDNRSIPVLITDSVGKIIMQRNFNLPEPEDSLNPLNISPENREYLQTQLTRIKRSDRVIPIQIADGSHQYIYYDRSELLHKLRYYPYAMVAVAFVFGLVLYFALRISRNAEQNKVWVGLSKETAHQLGTPISSLMAWMQLLQAQGVDQETVAEMDKDVTRLSVIASRFSKVGSAPQMEETDLCDLLAAAVAYMRPRISKRINLTLNLPASSVDIVASPPLLEWVIENLIKNAVDAIEGAGSISVTLVVADGQAFIEVTDTGKGMNRKQRRRVFNPGYTTKLRGWGLGLALAKRIVNTYHNGKISVANTEPGKGTTFLIVLPIKTT